MRHFLACLTVLCVLSLSNALAAPTDSKESTIGMVTGGLTGTYIRMGKDIADIAKTQDVTIDVKESRGSIDNIKRINSAENAALGIVQSDMLGYMKRADDPEFRRMSQDLRMLFPFYKEEIHVFANRNIQTFSELTGKRVAVGIEGSGHWLTAINLLTITDTSPAELVRREPADAVVDVLRGRVDAMIFVGGKPVKLFKNLEDLQTIEAKEYQQLLGNVHFIPLSDPRIFTEYSMATISPADYSFISAPVPTAAVTAVLVSYDFSGDSAYHKRRCNAIGKIGYALRTHIDTLRRDGHPKWNEVDLENRDVGIWQKDRCVDSYRPVTAGVNTPTPAAEKVQPKSAIEAELLRTIQQRYQGEVRP